MGAHNEVSESVGNSEHSNPNGIVRRGVDSKCEGVEGIAVKWGHELFRRIPFPISFDAVFHCEGELVPNAIRVDVNLTIQEGEKGSRAHSSDSPMSPYGLYEKTGFEGLKTWVNGG